MTSSNFMGLVWTVLIGLAVFGMIYAMYTGSNLKRNYERLIASGFGRDHVLSGSVVVVFDDRQRKVAFVFADCVRQYEYRAISAWDWEWQQRNGKHVVDYIKFTLRDAQFPLVKTRLNTQAA